MNKITLWENAPGSHQRVHLMTADAGIIATVFTREQPEEPDDFAKRAIGDSEALETARLLAAASQMLMALQTLDKMLADLPMPAARNVVRCAIAKATGGEG